MTRHIPNLLTTSRFFMAIAYFIVVGFYDRGTPASWPILDIALGIFIVGALTDTIDGYLARRLGHLTTFGRIADPFVDKIIVCGALVYFMGNQFLAPGPNGTMVNLTGWAPWMVVVIVARELLVTGMRSFSESHHIPFAATLSGKIKMFVQCFAICWSLVYVEHWANGPVWTVYVRDVLIWTTTLATGLSGLFYVQRAYHILRLPPD